MTSIAAPPTDDSVIELDQTRSDRRTPYYMAKAWIVWFLQSLLPRITSAPETLVVDKAYTDQHASIGLTTLPAGTLAAGVYIVWYYLRVTTSDGVASSVQVTLGWTENGGGAQVLSGAPLNTDSTAIPQSGAVRVTIGANTALTFQTTYASTTPNQMRYRLSFSVIRVGTL